MPAIIQADAQREQRPHEIHPRKWKTLKYLCEFYFLASRKFEQMTIDFEWIMCMCGTLSSGQRDQLPNRMVIAKTSIVKLNTMYLLQAECKLRVCYTPSFGGMHQKRQVQ